MRHFPYMCVKFASRNQRTASCMCAKTCRHGCFSLINHITCGGIQPFAIYWYLPLDISPPTVRGVLLIHQYKKQKMIYMVHGEIFISSINITTKELIEGMSYFTKTYQDITYQYKEKTTQLSTPIGICIKALPHSRC